MSVTNSDRLCLNVVPQLIRLFITIFTVPGCDWVWYMQYARNLVLSPIYFSSAFGSVSSRIWPTPDFSSSRLCQVVCSYTWDVRATRERDEISEATAGGRDLSSDISFFYFLRGRSAHHFFSSRPMDSFFTWMHFSEFPSENGSWMCSHGWIMNDA